jgi:hypothetical protein
LIVDDRLKRLQCRLMTPRCDEDLSAYRAARYRAFDF